ncbi:MAG: murein biosynthesis integral membrane protein MurJ, partial [Elusimicrobiales bacterium]|nr:murein biosynthesis integral membrane protein MurJ [Elusimicrobiales bacterium]
MDTKSTFIKNLLGFSSATLISKLLGFARDAMIVFIFGGGKLTDAYYAAFRITNLLRRTVGEGAINASIVPILAKEKEQSHEKAVSFFSAILIFSVGASIILCVIAVIFRYELVKLISYGFLKNPEQYELTVFLTAILMPHIIFVTLAAVFQSALNVSKRFFAPALAPAIFSIIIIGYLTALNFGFLSALEVKTKLLLLAAIATLSGAFQCIALFPLIKKELYRVKWANPFKNPKIMPAIAMMAPAILSIAQDQIAMFINTIFASFMASGSITAIYNSARIIHFPIALFAVSAAQVALPDFSKNLLLREKEEFKKTFNFSIKLTLLILAPATAGILVLALPIVRTLFEHGQFSYQQSLLTAEVLFFFSMGLMGYGINKIVSAAYYAAGDIKFILKITAFQMILNTGLCALFAKYMGAGGLTLATSITALLAAFIFLKTLNKKFSGSILEKNTFIILGKIIPASILMGVFAKYFNSFLLLSIGHIPATLITIVSSILVYFTLLKLFNVKERNSILKFNKKQEARGK